MAARLWLRAGSRWEKIPGQSYVTGRLLGEGSRRRSWDRIAIDAEDLGMAINTGGTAEAGIKLIERLGGEIIGCAFVIDLPDLGGRARIEALGMDVHVLCEFEGE